MRKKPREEGREKLGEEGDQKGRERLGEEGG